jgi:mRNA degradation ribonuclease J1/J2
VVGEPEIISRGFDFVRDADEMFKAAQARIAEAAARANGNLREKVQQSLADFFYAELKRRPMIFTLVNPA